MTARVMMNQAVDPIVLNAITYNLHFPGFIQVRITILYMISPTQRHLSFYIFFFRTVFPTLLYRVIEK